MKIKGTDGHEYSVTGQNQGNLNTVLGALGTASFAGLNAGNLLGGVLGGGYRGMGDDAPISRYEANMLMALQAKDSKIALLESNIYTDGKFADVYERLNSKIDANKDAQDAINREQATMNAATTAALTCMKGQIAQLYSLTDIVVPQAKVVETGCCGA